MPSPAPIRLIERAIERLRFPVIIVGLLISLPLLGLFYGMGALRVQPDFEIWNRPMEIRGFFILASLLPAYLVMCFTAWIRSSNALFAAIENELHENPAITIDRFQFARFWPVAMAVGIFFAYQVNINWSTLEFDSDSLIFTTSIAMVLGQSLTWAMIALVLFFTLHEHYILSRYGKYVQVNLYDLDRLNGFGRAALSGFLMTAGALAFMTLQSLDQRFVWGNYAIGLYVGLPAAIAFMLLPTWTVHKNIKAEKTKAENEITAAISSSSSALDNDSLTRLNGLIARREQIRHLRTWPMNVSIFSRLLFYVFIPPLAWLGAALMEVLLDSYIAG